MGDGISNACEKIPPWREQITVRGLVVSALLGCLFCIITHKLNLTVGVIPSLNVAAGLLGFFLVRSWTGLLEKLGFQISPFTRQENTVIQTCVVACYGLAFSGGFGSYMLSMDQKTYELIGSDYPGNRAEDVKNPSLGWMIGYMFVVSFLGLFSLVALRKVMVIDYKLTYPSGTATALLINSFHTNAGAELAGCLLTFPKAYNTIDNETVKAALLLPGQSIPFFFYSSQLVLGVGGLGEMERKQVRCLGKYLSISFLWSCFKWFFSGVGNSCGFENFPTFGLEAFKNTFLKETIDRNLRMRSGSSLFGNLYGET
ncbi:hypothetical protein HPP92_009886 [Vanilla planifolia]|uniref:Uncharacterized protein n=1 Tax=Vanilla planifolia TaxID=51239 RepID=A0A835RGM7_VANPL|nr:hypothetical protein HPP92_009886 [Vanilla planifolia]